MTLRQRSQPFRSRRWLSAIHDLDCVLCGSSPVQAAHRNQGKGMGMKTDDSLCAALCMECHSRIDNGRDMTRDERRMLLDDAICRTLAQLTRQGKVVCL